MSIFGASRTNCFTALCQNPAGCKGEQGKTILGQMHIPCAAGHVKFVCYRCGGITKFKNTEDGFIPEFLGVAPELLPPKHPK